MNSEAKKKSVGELLRDIAHVNADAQRWSLCPMNGNLRASMKPEAKKKSAGEFLRDIAHINADKFPMNSPDPSRGVVCPKTMNRICFAATVLTLAVSATTLLLLLWDYPPEIGVKCVGSVLVILFMLLIFRYVNVAFVESK